MTEELPPLWALDMAAQKTPRACGDRFWRDWRQVEGGARDWIKGLVIAHARTLERLAKHEPDIVPVDEDEEVLVRILSPLYKSIHRDAQFMKGLSWWPDALAKFKTERDSFRFVSK